MGIFKNLLHHKIAIGSIRLPHLSLVMLLIVRKFTPPMVYKLQLMEEIRLTSWYGESTTIYTGFLYIRGGFLARFLVAINSTRTLNRTEAESKFLFVSSPAGVSSSERRVRCQFVRKLTGNASENRLFYSKEKPDQACSCGGCNLIFQIRDFFYPPWNLHGPWKSMVGRWISFWEGLCHWWAY